MAVQEGPTSIRVSWSPPTPLGDTTGYRIYYSGGSSGSVNVSDGSTDNYLLTGLQNGESYTISIVATSQHLPSESIAADMEVMLGEDIHDLIMHEMQGKATQHNRKTRQHNTTCPGQLFLKAAHVQVAVPVQEGSGCVCVCHRIMPCHTLCSDYILQSLLQSSLVSSL